MELYLVSNGVVKVYVEEEDAEEDSEYEREKGCLWEGFLLG
jgi:hypothetical protein